ncbi:lipid droplet-associated protein [Williamsia sp. MIQD14]|uniref:lipid droplet-associated protein n=1 Tax=Williamsia sp. MIQD14 TaxID=3425703 RepID=UPI003DA06E84
MTAIEETKKLPTTAVTLPMTAVSSTVQAAMRMQQNIAELAIKGDEVFDTLFHRAEEKPEWATFDDDDAFMDPAPSRADRSPVDDGDEESDDHRGSDDSSADAGATVTPISAAPGAATVTPADMPEHQAETVEPTPPVKKAPAKKVPAKKVAAKAPAKKAPAAKKTPAKKAPAAPASDDDSATGKGRFALYSSAPETVLQSDVESSPAAPAADAPEIVEFLDYDALTLAQLRAKIRSVDLDDLRALADYERGHRGRAPFQTMLDNRITAASAK